MVSILSPSLNSTMQVKDAVFVAALPLRVSKGPAQLLTSAAYSLGLRNLRHYMVIIRRSSPPQSQVFVYDFQPQDPESLDVALEVIFQKSVPGIIQVRKLAKLPSNRCWFVGYSKDDAILVADKFNENWLTDLKVGEHDCRHYTEGLIEQLTGRQQILNQLDWR